MKQGKSSMVRVAGVVVLCASISVNFPVSPFSSALSVCLAPKGIAAPAKKNNVVLESFLHHVRRAGAVLKMSPEDVQNFLKPKRVVEVECSVALENGKELHFKGGRVMHSDARGPGKGGIRAAEGLDAAEEEGLAGLMSVKTAVIDVPTGGGKGGVNVNPRNMTPVDFGRVMRAYVKAVMDKTWQEHGTIAFHLLTDVPAPDMNTNAAHMNICIDEVLLWLTTHRQEYTEWLKRRVKEEELSKYHIPLELATLLGSNPALEGVEKDQDEKVKTVPKTPYLDLYFDLYTQKRIPTLALIGAFTSKEEENEKKGTKGKGGSQGRTAATGLGVVYSTLQVLHHEGVIKTDQKFERKDARSEPITVAVQGYGNVGEFAVKNYASRGARVMAIAEFDTKPYAIYCETGFTPEVLKDLDEYILQQRKATNDFQSPNGKFLRGFASVHPAVHVISTEQFWKAEVDVLAPCALHGQITQAVAPLISDKVRFIAEGANAPTTPEADEILVKRGVRLIPDVLANAGGVTVSCYEMEQNAAGVFWTEEEVNRKLYEQMKENVELVYFVANMHGIDLRLAAFVLAITRILESGKPEQQKTESPVDAWDFRGFAGQQLTLFDLAI